MSSMIVRNQTGSLNVLLLPLIATSLLLVGTLAFASWAFVSRQDFKNNSDQKSADAVTIAEQKQKTELENEFLEREKEPLRDYKGAAVLGAINFKYPKTWSGYVDETNEKLTIIMDPALVPAGARVNHALRVTVDNAQYDAVLKQFDSDVRSGKVRASAFRLDKLPDVLGSRFDGEIATGVQGSVVVLPLRDKTVKISTESQQFLQDFNTIILPNFSFTP